ncbi:hypothetical protein EWM63_12185 [Pseudoduganella lutea]|uniref:Uncharacterized protein n=1 Tax=Pseudoduganella lutea TaxID=321985 RepID=A0A4P6KZ88_9BURK|nr:hypothetical protein EWM63_12185 [Pseudoduganella lutea]
MLMPPPMLPMPPPGPPPGPPRCPPPPSPRGAPPPLLGPSGLRCSCSTRNTATARRCGSSSASFTVSHHSRSCLSSASAVALSASSAPTRSRSSISRACKASSDTACIRSARDWRSRSSVRVLLSVCCHKVC